MIDPSPRSRFQAALNLRPVLVTSIFLAALVSLNDERFLQQSVNVLGADPAASKPDNQEPAEGSDDEPLPAPPPSRPTEKQIKAYSGLAALAGIVIAGLALVALTILWAGRLRRQLRRPLPECDAPGRDFWFLKPPKPTVTQSSLPDAHQPPHSPPPDAN